MNDGPDNPELFTRWLRLNACVHFGQISYSSSLSNYLSSDVRHHTVLWSFYAFRHWFLTIPPRPYSLWLWIRDTLYILLSEWQTTHMQWEQVINWLIYPWKFRIWTWKILHVAVFFLTEECKISTLSPRRIVAVFSDQWLKYYRVSLIYSQKWIRRGVIVRNQWRKAWKLQRTIWCRVSRDTWFV